MSSLRVMVKRRGEKKQQEETEKQQHVIVTENNLKVLPQKVFQIMTRNNPASLIVASHGISHSEEDSWTVDSKRYLPSLSSLLDYFRL